jgi:hypothetical protein
MSRLFEYEGVTFLLLAMGVLGVLYLRKPKEED